MLRSEDEEAQGGSPQALEIMGKSQKRGVGVWWGWGRRGKVALVLYKQVIAVFPVKVIIS